MINKTNVLSMHVRGAPMSKEDLQEAIETVYERQCEAEKALAEHDGNGEK